ncbi:Uncharacterised protein [Salmonella enterica subsp. enterica serovar Typhimurium str. DT104]|nr:Uncharacterised protein [Salmonella enterica subsp. enterica serovar Typhimurium str. DT104]
MISYFYSKSAPQCLKTENPRFCYKLNKNLVKFQKELDLLKQKKLAPKEYESQFSDLKEKFLAYEVNIKKHYHAKKSYKLRAI